MRHSNIFAARRSPFGALIVFLVCAFLAAAVIGYSEKSRIDQERNRVAALAGEYALAIQMNIEEELSAAYGLASLVQLNQGNIQGFETTANALRAFYPGVAALELAPGGVVQHIVPLAGNEKAIGHNLLKDPERDKEALRARDTGKLTLAGPFQLIQGGLGAAGRMPVYLKDKSGNRQFWGFAIVLIRFPDALAPAHLPLLAEKGYSYALSRVHPDTRVKHVIAASPGNAPVNPVNREVSIPNASWTLSIAPRDGWIDPVALAAKGALAMLVAMSIAAAWQKLRRR